VLNGGLTPERLLVGAAVVLTCILFTSAALDPVNVIKLTALTLIAIALAALGAVRLVRLRTARLPLSTPGATAVALALALAIAAASAPMSSTALWGTYGRNSGLVAYLAALVLYVAGLRVFGGQNARVLVGSIVLAGLFTASYGLLQKAGVDPVPWSNPFNPIIAALGNPNFASGYLGIAASVAAGGTLYNGWPTGWRALSATTSFLCLVAAALSASVQGPIAAASGLLIVAVGFLLNLRSRRKRPLLAGLGVAAASAVAVLVLGATTKAGPAAALFSDVGSEARTHYWAAALQMFRDAPLLGVGLDHYGAFWRTARSPGSVVALGGGQYSDAAHSVPLQMLAQGGIILGAAYAAFVLVVLVALVRGLLRLRGDDRTLLAAVGGGWTAYQVQSAVSIDQVPLIVLHFTLAAAVIGAAGVAGLRELRLPGAPEHAITSAGSARARRKAVAAATRQRPLTAGDGLAIAVVAALALAAAWQTLVPLRANIAAKQGDSLLARGDGSGASQAYDQATELTPAQSLYWVKKGQLFQRHSPPRPEAAKAAYLRAVEENPYEIGTVRGLAALAEREGDLALSRRLHHRALAVDPLNPETLVAATTFELRHSGAERARRVLEGAVTQLPDQPALWATLGDAKAVLGDTDGAQQAYERALVLKPGQATAVEGIRKLATTD
jgi:putative inorganic carbon (HCO3(-)) transporter